MMPPITTETRAREGPWGPEPNTIGTGPMKTTPPTDELPWPADPKAISATPAMMARSPRGRSFRV